MFTFIHTCKHSTDPNVTAICEVTQLQNKQNYCNPKVQHWTWQEVFKCYIKSITYNNKQDNESFLNNANSTKELKGCVLKSILHATSTSNWVFSFLRHANPHSKMLKIWYQHCTHFSRNMKGWQLAKSLH